jgi:ABC-2 type transport system permease protein
MRWLTPYGWMDNLRAYGEPSPVALGLLLVAPGLLVALAARLRARRDAGAAVVRTQDTRAARLRGLGSPVEFAWRSSRGVLTAWAVGLGAYALLVGTLLPTMSDYLVDEPSFKKVMEQLGIEAWDIQLGLVSFLSVMFGLAFALYACWRIGAARGEEESGRAELLLAGPVTRRGWLGGHVLLCLASVLLLALTTGLSAWAGGALVGAQVGVVDSLQAALNPVPVALLFVALAVLVLGVRPRLTVALSASAAGVAYLIPVLGSTLDLPGWVTAVSPFQHLATVPVEPYALTSGVVMCLAAAVGTVLGVRLFSRRDLAGA